MLNLDDVKSSVTQDTTNLSWLVVGAFLIAFSRNDVLPNTTMSYISFMNGITEIGLGVMIVCVVSLFNICDDLNAETFAWKLGGQGRGTTQILFSLDALVFLITCIIAVTVTA